MIKNKRQYKITKAKLEDLEIALTKIDRHDSNLHPRQILGRVNSLERTIGNLRTEIDEYVRELIITDAITRRFPPHVLHQADN